MCDHDDVMMRHDKMQCTFGTHYISSVAQLSTESTASMHISKMKSLLLDVIVSSFFLSILFRSTLH